MKCATDTHGSLFDAPPVPAHARHDGDPCARRHGGAATSRAAWATVNAAESRGRVLGAIRYAGERGATLGEIGEVLGVQINTISGRVTELRAARMIVKVGERPGPSGRGMSVYRVT